MGANSSSGWPRCKKNRKCPALKRLLKYGSLQQDIDHCSVYLHELEPCRYGNEWISFIRSQQGSWDTKDQVHLLCYAHSRRNYLNTANLVTCRDIKVISTDQNRNFDKKVVFSGYLTGEFKQPVDGPQTNLWSKEEKHIHTVEEINTEVVINGFGWVLNIQHEQYSTLSQLAAEMTNHPKNRWMLKNPKNWTVKYVWDSVLSQDFDNWSQRHVSELNTPDILSILLYTGTEVQGAFRRDMIEHKHNDIPKWPLLYDSLWRAYRHLRDLQGDHKFIGTTYHGLSSTAVTDLSTLVTQEGEWWQAGFVLPTFFSTSRDKQVAIDFASGDVGTEETKENGLVIEFKWHKIGVDVSWISKFRYEQEILLPPFVIASADFNQKSTYSTDICKGNSPKKIGRTKGNHHSVYSSQEEALKAIRNWTSGREVTSSRSGRKFRVQWIKLVVKPEWWRQRRSDAAEF